MSKKRILTGLMMAGLLGMSGIAAAPAQASTSTAVLADYCGGNPPGAGSVPGDRFAGTRSVACNKCREMGLYMRAKGQISQFWCEYYAPLGYARMYIK